MTRFLAALVLMVSTAHSWGAVTLYTNEADYLVAVGGTRTFIDFAGSPAATVSGGSFSPDVTFGSCTDSSAPTTCGTAVFHDSNAITDLGGSASANQVASLAWRFNLGDVLAFGFNYISGGIAGINLVDTTLGLTLIDTSGASGFIGLVSDDAFFGGIAVNAVFASGGNDRYFIDDFRINSTVPEPASLALALLALAIVTRSRRLLAPDSRRV